MFIEEEAAYAGTGKEQDDDCPDDNFLFSGPFLARSFSLSLFFVGFFRLFDGFLRLVVSFHG